MCVVVVGGYVGVGVVIDVVVGVGVGVGDVAVVVLVFVFMFGAVVGVGDFVCVDSVLDIVDHVVVFRPCYLSCGARFPLVLFLCITSRSIFSLLSVVTGCVCYCLKPSVCWCESNVRCCLHLLVVVELRMLFLWPLLSSSLFLFLL